MQVKQGDRPKITTQTGNHLISYSYR